jgi:hypothetical protein
MEHDTSAVVEPSEIIGTVTDVDIDLYEGDYGDITRLVLELGNPHYENPASRRWKFTRNEQGQVRKACELNQMVLKPLKLLGRRIVDFEELKGLTLRLDEHQLKYNIDGEDIIKDTWIVKGAYDSFEDAENARLEESGEKVEEEKKSEPPKEKPKARKKKPEPEPEPESEADEEEDEEPAKAEEGDVDLQSFIHSYLQSKPKRRIKKDTIVAEVVKEFDVDDNDVEDALTALKKDKKVREPKLGQFQVA